MTPSNSNLTSNLEWRCSFFLKNVNQIDMFFCYGQSTKIHFRSLSSTFQENDYFGSNTYLNVAHPILYLSSLTSFINIKEGRNLCNQCMVTEKKHCFCLCNKPKIIMLYHVQEITIQRKYCQKFQGHISSFLFSKQIGKVWQAWKLLIIRKQSLLFLNIEVPNWGRLGHIVFMPHKHQQFHEKMACLQAPYVKLHHGNQGVPGGLY